MNGKDSDIERLRELTRDASPAPAKATHVTDAELARMRADEDSPDLDGAYTHMASCASCRARLLEPPEVVARLVRQAPTPLEPRAPVVARASRARLYFAMVAAAAVVVLALGVGSRDRGRDEPLAIAQRAYAPTMGAEDGRAPLVAPEDADVELSLTAHAGDGAALLVLDGTGQALAPVRWFGPGEGDRLVAVVAPRAFAPHAGRAFGLVIAGAPDRVRAVVDGIARSASASPDALEQSVRARDDGVRVRRVVIGAVQSSD